MWGRGLVFLQIYRGLLARRYFCAWLEVCVLCAVACLCDQSATQVLSLAKFTFLKIDIACLHTLAKRPTVPVGTHFNVTCVFMCIYSAHQLVNRTWIFGAQILWGTYENPEMAIACTLIL